VIKLREKKTHFSKSLIAMSSIEEKDSQVAIANATSREAAEKQLQELERDYLVTKVETSSLSSQDAKEAPKSASLLSTIFTLENKKHTWMKGALVRNNSRAGNFRYAIVRSVSSKKEFRQYQRCARKGSSAKRADIYAVYEVSSEPSAMLPAPTFVRKANWKCFFRPGRREDTKRIDITELTPYAKCIKFYTQLVLKAKASSGSEESTESEESEEESEAESEAESGEESEETIGSESESEIESESEGLDDPSFIASSDSEASDSRKKRKKKSPPKRSPPKRSPKRSTKRSPKRSPKRSRKKGTVKIHIGKRKFEIETKKVERCDAFEVSNKAARAFILRRIAKKGDLDPEDVRVTQVTRIEIVRKRRRFKL